MFRYTKLVALLLLIEFCIGGPDKGSLFKGDVCEHLLGFESIRLQIKNHTKEVQTIINYITNGPDKGQTYKKLADFVDKFGPRLAGTQTFEDSIDFVKTLMKNDKHDNVHTENVPLIPWIRGNEWANILSPRNKSMSILGLGGSVGTNGKVIKADVIVVKTFEELKQRAQEVPGKIIVFNFDYESYSADAKYRGYGASEAAQYGAIAAMVRSLTPLSINSPHTGGQSYYKNVTQIPAVSITVEDAEMIHRFVNRGEKVSVQLYMEAKYGKQMVTRNLISELKGTQHPEQVVIVSGHLDSWDVGQGAMDDGGGALISWRALSILKKLNLKPKRTLRAILWAAEEYGLVGAQAYVKDHIKEFSNISIAMESDFGTFRPTGLSYSGNNTTAQCIVHEILQMLKPINTSQMIISNDGSDTYMFLNESVPISSLQNLNDKYFEFHHSNGDTMTVENSDDLDLCLALFTATSYMFSVIDHLLPR